MINLLERIMPERPLDWKTKIIIAVAVVLLVLIVGILIMRGMNGDNSGSGGKDTPYPYKYEVQKDGTMLLIIKAKEGCSWISVEESETILSVEAAPREEKSDKTSLLIRALQVGGQNMTLYLVADGDEPIADAALATYVFSVIVDESQVESITQLDFYEKAPNVLIEGTAGEKAYYNENPEGSISVYVDSDYKVDFVTDGALAQCNEGNREGEYRKFDLMGTVGNGNVTMLFRKSATEDLVLKLSMNTSEEGTTKVGSASFDKAEATYELDAESKEARTRAKELFGKELGVPKGAIQISYVIENWYDEADLKAAIVKIAYDGQYWRYIISNQLTTEELCRDIPTFASEKKTEVINDISVTAMSFNDGVMMVWQDASGRACGLTGNSMSTDEALETAKKFL